jgi:hypothetical protein
VCVCVCVCVVCAVCGVCVVCVWCVVCAVCGVCVVCVCVRVCVWCACGVCVLVCVCMCVCVCVCVIRCNNNSLHIHTTSSQKRLDKETRMNERNITLQKLSCKDNYFVQSIVLSKLYELRTECSKRNSTNAQRTRPEQQDSQRILSMSVSRNFIYNLRFSL